MKLILRADDLGFSDGVSLGIVKAVKDGVITSVGMMSNMEGATFGYECIKDYDIALGLHSNICAGRPVSDPTLIPSLVNEQGEFCSSKEIRSREVDTVVLQEAEMEVEAQLNRFIEITGKKPDYLEGHAVMSKNFFKAIRNIAEKYDIFFDNPIFDPDWEKETDIIGFPFPAFDQKGLYDPKKFMNDHLSTLQEHRVGIAVFHPGYLDQYILDQSSFTLIRPMECEFLCSDWIKEWIKDHQIQLIDFRDLK